MCVHRGSKMCPSLVVEGGYYYCRYVSPTLCGRIAILLFELCSSVTVISLLYGLNTICVTSV